MITSTIIKLIVQNDLIIPTTIDFLLIFVINLEYFVSKLKNHYYKNNLRI